MLSTISDTIGGSTRTSETHIQSPDRNILRGFGGFVDRVYPPSTTGSASLNCGMRAKALGESKEDKGMRGDLTWRNVESNAGMGLKENMSDFFEGRRD